MFKRISMISIIFVIIVAYTCCENSEENKIIITEARKKHEFLENFLSKYSENNLVLVMNFIENPDIFFKKIKNIQELFAYFEIIDRLAVNDRKFTEISFDSFVTKRFNEHNLTELRVKIFTFLLLNSEGYFGEILADQYSKLFSKFSEKFLIVLAKEPEWKRIVYSLDAGDWETFKTAVEKLGDSGFEGEFKRFVLAPLDKEGKRIIK